MTSFKFLVICCGMLAAAWSLAEAATTADPDNTAEVTGAPSTDVPKTTHHKRHHKTATTASTSTNAPAAATTAGTEAKKSKTSTTADASESGSKKSKTAANDKTDKSDKTGQDKETANASGSATASTTPSPATSHRHKKTHATETAAASTEKTPSKSKVKPAEGEKTATVKTPAPPAATPAPPTTAVSTNIGAAAAASSVINSQTAVAPPGKGRHHRHSHTAPAPTLPEPPIVITTVNVPPMSTGASTVPPLGMPPASGSIVPTVETGLPVPRPGAGTTATLAPIAMIRSPTAPPVDTHFTFNDYNEHKTRTYPWKSGIVTTVFWIGEGSTPLSGMTNKMSAWDMNWVHDNGGADDQYDMSGYASGSHASLINPFYVALPFNDLAYPDKTQRWLPVGWSKPTHHGDKPVSACQGRWIEIKNRAGRVCFAQWEDVGPINTDDAEYVFGPYRPSASRGLDVSPAVAKYLGIDSTAITSWRFVDDDDVQPGMWLRYNEQAILFQALKDQARRNTPLQDLSQPVPDGADDSDSQKQIRAGRG